jgi:GNAT superfamily N-acetyltransferase
MTITIRAAQRGEAGLVLDFVRELAGYERLRDSVDATEDMIDTALFAPHPRVFCDIAEWNGAPAGFALWFVSYSSFRGRHGLYLEDLFVRPQYRRRGIGRSLFVHLARRCVAEGWMRFEWAVLNWNEPSIRFYQALGAVLLDDWKIGRLTGTALEQAAALERA